MFRTAENVTRGHPDKVCDQIADAVLDAYLAQDSKSRVAVEVFGGHGLLLIAGEVTSAAEVDAGTIAKQVYADAGYRDPLEVQVRIVRQSPDIAQGVDRGGAGDQGIMVGYATAETTEAMPLPVVLARELVQGFDELRVPGKSLAGLGPDGKAQVTVRGSEPVAVLMSVQHPESVSVNAVRARLVEHLIRPRFPVLDERAVYVNPTGAFTIGGFASDTGLTGRKVIVDTYGPLVPHGGGAFSGKDPTKVDRSGAYFTRAVAKELVRRGAKEAWVKVAYAIGRAEPLMVDAEADGNDVSTAVANEFDFRPLAMIERLNLRRPIYRPTAAYGHFGRPGFPWEEPLP
jgi:S-adenosylmethionine synthetase